MPAINPSVLNDKVELIFAETLKADAFARQIHELLSFYADRTKRTTATAAALETAHMMHVPSPVLRNLCTMIHKRGRREGDEWIPAAQQLWRSGLQEMRLVAICMLSEAPSERMLGVASTWAAESEEQNVLRSLASEGIGPWRQSNPDQTLASAGGWIEAESTQVFGLIVLQKSIQDESISDLPAVFDMLSGLPAVARGLELDALRDLLLTLAQRSPAETTAFMLEEIASGEIRAQRLARAIAEALPAAFRSQLRQTL